MAQVALAWALKNPVVAARIVGATKSQHLPDAVAALDLRPSEEEVRTLEQPYTLAKHQDSEDAPPKSVHLMRDPDGASSTRSSTGSESR